jgi:integrative and conjugative element protein (TIGR02256 family)
VKWWSTLWRTEPTETAENVAPLSALVLQAAIGETLRLESQRKYPNETGGVLVGYVDRDGRTVLTAVVGPGPGAIHSRSRFRRDGDYAQAEVDRLHLASDGRDDYIGEWHSHPDAGGPSYVDRGSMSWISNNPSYGRRDPVLLIMERVRKRAWRPRAYRWVEDRLVEVRAIAHFSDETESLP